MSKQLTILLVDDEKNFLETINDRMQIKGFRTLLAYDGDQALKLAKENHIDAAIVDLKMPGMDGLVCITKLKEIHHDLKTVLLTGYGDAKVKEASEGLDSAYFEKSEMSSFWSFIKSMSLKIENSMAEAGYAQGGDLNGAKEVFEKEK